MGKNRLNRGESSYYVETYEQPSEGKEVVHGISEGGGFKGWEAETPRYERNHSSWEDNATGSYCRYSSGVQYDGEQYREYKNVSFRDAEEGRSGKCYSEERYERVPQSQSGKRSSSSNYVRYSR